MKNIYCIASGSYSDWGIDYSFESECKRDKLLKIISNGDYHEYELELCDDDIDVDDIDIWYTLQMYDFLEDKTSFEVLKCNTHTDIRTKNPISIHEGKLVSFEIEITKEEYNDIELYREKYEKIWCDNVAKVKYLVEVEGFTDEEIEDLLNKK